MPLDALTRLVSYLQICLYKIRGQDTEQFLKKIGKLKTYPFLGPRGPLDALKCVNQTNISCAVIVF